MLDVSIDIETLGTTPGAVILSIGAVSFSPDHHNPEGCFYRNIDTLSSLMRGMTVDSETVEWWRDPKRDKARAFLGSDEASLDDTLREFTGWFRNIGEVRHVYAKPPSFDCVLIEDAFRRCGLPVPWTFRQPRCVRTALTWSGFDEKTVPFIGVEHYALDDAIHQARVVQLARAAQ